MLDPTLLPPLLIFLLALHILYTHTSNPLRLVPAAHPLAHWTSLWIAYSRWSGRENRTLKEAHDRLGPVVCLGPKEVSVNCVKGGIREVYAGGFEKGGDLGSGVFNWYGFFANFGGVPNMFSTGPNKPHSTRKRMLSNIYSKSTLTLSRTLYTCTSRILLTRLLPLLTPPSPSPSKTLNITPLLSATTLDIITSYIFGLSSSSSVLLDPSKRDRFLALYNSRRSYNFWPQEFPRFTAWVRRWCGYRFVPTWVDDANSEIEAWTWSMCEKASNTLHRMEKGEVKEGEEDVPVVYRQLITALIKDKKEEEEEEEEAAAKQKTPNDQPTYKRKKVASELLDHLAAGFETSTITLLYTIHALSTHPAVQTALRKELLSIAPSPATTLPSPETLQSLPLLHATLLETLRLHPAIPGPQPRTTPPQGCKLGDVGSAAGFGGVVGGGGEFYIPGGVRVSASAGILHRNEDVFGADAAVWVPGRWLEGDDSKKAEEMKRWFWAFGSGGRMCIGSNLAMYQMKYILYTLYTTHTTSLAVDDDDDNDGTDVDMEMEQMDAYTAPPVQDRLLIKLTRM